MGRSQEINSSFNLIIPNTIHLIYSLILILAKHSLTTTIGVVVKVMVMEYIDVVIMDVAELDAYILDEEKGMDVDIEIVDRLVLKLFDM